MTGLMLRLQGELIERVDDGMHARGWTQRQLAARAGISEKHLSQLLQGTVWGSVGAWDRLLTVTAAVDLRPQPIGGPADEARDQNTRGSGKTGEGVRAMPSPGQPQRTPSPP